MKFKAYTFAEVLIAMTVISIISVVMCVVFSKNNYKTEACKKAGLNSMFQIEFATKQIISKNSKNYTMTTLKDSDGSIFSINDSGADEKLAKLYKKILYAPRGVTIPSAYTSLDLKNEAGETIGENLKVSSFTQGFKAQNKFYIAFLLHNDCTTNETYIYNPEVPEKRTATKSCGLIFFDTNVDDEPNIVGIDMYIVPIGKIDIR